MTKLPQVNCFCFTLEQGAILVGFFHTICASFIVIFCSYLASEFNENIGTIEDYDGTYSKWAMYTTLLAATGAIHIILGIMLLVGVYKRKLILLKAWVYLMIAVMGAAILFVLCETLWHGVNTAGSDLLLNFLQGLMFFGVTIYAILCVNTLYLIFKSDEDTSGPKNENTLIKGVY